MKHFEFFKGIKAKLIVSFVLTLGFPGVLRSDPARYQDGTIVSTTTQLTISSANPVQSIGFTVTLTAKPSGVQKSGVRISSSRLQADGSFQFAFDASPGRSYLNSVSSNLVDWSLLTNVTSVTSHILVSDAPAAKLPRRFYRVGTLTTVPISNMVFIQPGSFTMGSPANEVDRDSDEGPQTLVTISQGFWMGKYEVTQGEYLAVIGSNPSSFEGDTNRPVDSVSWVDATSFCAKLTARERTAGRFAASDVYRLPTEAEWEYAARAGSTTRFSYGDDPGYGKLGDYAWFFGNSGNTTHPLGLKLPNPWGLYDMAGNVYECCLDWYGTYPGGNVSDPRGPASGSYRVIRGGGCYGDGRGCRSAIRRDSAPGGGYNYLGFRLVLAPGQ